LVSQPIPLPQDDDDEEQPPMDEQQVTSGFLTLDEARAAYNEDQLRRRRRRFRRRSGDGWSDDAKASVAGEPASGAFGGGSSTARRVDSTRKQAVHRYVVEYQGGMMGWCVWDTESDDFVPDPIVDRLTREEAEAIAAELNSKVSSRKHAHQSGDFVRIFHCPFCGSGQVIAQSNGNTYCEHCDAAFVVESQPKFPSIPQTDVGAMPELGMEDEVDPEFDDEFDDEELDEDEELDDPSMQGGDSPWDKAMTDDLTKSTASLRGMAFITEEGTALPADDYMRYLAQKLL
jgi:transcription elongation factor Elf1